MHYGQATTLASSVQKKVCSEVCSDTAFQTYAKFITERREEAGNPVSAG